MPHAHAPPDISVITEINDASKILVLGASGFIGSAVSRSLKASGYQVVGAGRSFLKSGQGWDKNSWRQVDYLKLTDPQNWSATLDGIDVVVNCVGLIRSHGTNTMETVHNTAACALFTACINANIKQVIQFSALGADDAATSTYHLSKRAADDYLAEIAPDRTRLNWTILRPSLVAGRGGGSAALFAAMAYLPIIPLVAGGRQHVQPVHIDDVAEIVVRLVFSKDPTPRHLDVVGPDVMTIQDMLQLYRTWLGKRRAYWLPLPNALTPLIGWIGELLSRGAVNRETMAMLKRPKLGDTQALQSAMGFAPAHLADGLARHPALQAERRHAALYFLLPALRIGLALVWIFTGVVSLGVYPLADSLELVRATGLTGSFAVAAVIGGGLLDLVLGLLLLARIKVFWVGAAQLATMALYSLIISLTMAELWLHPFGPITKNIPLAIATLIVMVTEDA